MTTPDPVGERSIYEIVDRLSGRRATEVVYLTAQRALDQVAAWVQQYDKPEIGKQYRVQGVRVDG